MSFNNTSDHYPKQPIKVYGFLTGHLPRLIAIVNSEVAADRIGRKWKDLTFAEKQQWVSDPQKIRRVMK